jgi:ATP-dependent helicase/DNAse subunit B
MSKDKLNELRSNGVTVYSFSRLGTFNNCQYEYFKSYVKREKGIENCYTTLGSTLHDGLESIYRGEKTIDDFKRKYNDKLVELDLLGINFPSDKIGDSWKSDIGNFLDNFNKMDKKMSLEKLILFEIEEGVWLQGYIDVIAPSEKGKPYVDIIDWKTSSKFTGKKLQEAGRQLLMYKLGLEDMSNFKVDNVMWFMLKYLYVCHMQKNGKVKKKMCNRGKWVKEIGKQIEKELVKLEVDEFEAELLLDKAIEENNLTCLPQDIQKKYWLEDCIVEHDTSEENLEEVKEYILNTIRNIESKNKEDEKEWKPVEIDKSTSFYCSVLCGHRKTCPFYKQYLEENSESFDKKDKKDEFDIFG